MDGMVKVGCNQGKNVFKYISIHTCAERDDLLNIGDEAIKRIAVLKVGFQQSGRLSGRGLTAALTNATNEIGGQVL